MKMTTDYKQQLYPFNSGRDARTVRGLAVDYRSAYDMGDPATEADLAIEKLVAMLSTPDGRSYCTNRGFEINLSREKPRAYYLTANSDSLLITKEPIAEGMMSLKQIGKYATDAEVYNAAMAEVMKREEADDTELPIRIYSDDKWVRVLEPDDLDGMDQ
jgi:hypothetical protein